MHFIAYLLKKGYRLSMYVYRYDPKMRRNYTYKNYADGDTDTHIDYLTVFYKKGKM